MQCLYDTNLHPSLLRRQPLPPRPLEPRALLAAHWLRRLRVRYTDGADPVLSQRHRGGPACGCYELDMHSLWRTNAIGVHLVDCVCSKVVQGPEGQRCTHDAWGGAADSGGSECAEIDLCWLRKWGT